MPFRSRATVAVLGAVTLWSLALPITELALETTSVAFLSFVRFALAGAVLLPFAVRDKGFGSAVTAPRTVLLGFSGVGLYYALSHTAIQLSTPGTIAIAGALGPAITALVAAVFLRERVSPKDILALSLATVGVGVVSLSGFRLDLGVVVFVTAMTSYAFYTVLLRGGWSSGSPSAVVVAAATFIWGTAFFLPWLLVDAAINGIRTPSPEGWAWVLVLAVVLTAPAAIWFSYGAERLPGVVTGTLIAAGPPLGYVFALLFGERADPIKMLGGAVAIAGVVVSTLPQATTQAAVSRSPGRADQA